MTFTHHQPKVKRPVMNGFADAASSSGRNEYSTARVDGRKSNSSSGDAKVPVTPPDTDPITGLLSFHGFIAALDDATERAARTNTSYVLIYVDIEDFRLLNEVHGVAFGDSVLRAVATVLTGDNVSWRPSRADDETVGRVGPDEFAVLIPGADSHAAKIRVDQITAVLSRLSLTSPTCEGDRLPVSARYGIAAYPDDGTSAGTLRRMAQEQAGQRAPFTLLEDTQALRREMERMVVGFHLLDAMVRAVDAKDAYTRRHSEDVLRYATRMGREMGLPPSDQRALMVAALLHDIGKVALPERLLCRPDALSPDEYETIKEHPCLGATLLGTLGAASERPAEVEKARQAVRHHHERWDGGGYPNGLVEEEIPLLARILAVADSYSAMTLDRPYRKAFSPAEAVSRLRAGAGVQWDAACVAALIRTL
jgi:diguanylate cyclase (GGDEF)-like protein